MAYQNILTDNSEGIFTITINRPDKLNALNKQTIAEVGMAITEAEKDASVSGIILTGSGTKAFIAGADISEFAAFSEAEGKELSAHGHTVFNSVENCSKPVVAAVNGFALGGGCELAMACHIRVASENAKFGQPEVNLGLIPGYGGTQRLPQLIGKGKAIELLMSADLIDANEAYRLGLINYIVAQDQLINKCREILNKIKTKAPLAVGEIIRTVNAHYDKKLNGYQEEINGFGKCFITEDFIEGTKAFLREKKTGIQIKIMTEVTGMRQVRILITGKVQGVFYRKFTRQMAMSLNICGYVQNQHNGTVLVKATGKPENIEKLIAWCGTGPKAAVITQINVEEIPVTNEYFTFEIRRSD